MIKTLGSVARNCRSRNVPAAGSQTQQSCVFIAWIKSGLRGQSLTLEGGGGDEGEIPGPKVSWDRCG